MSIVLDGTTGITTPDLESAGPISGTTGSFSGNVTLGSSVLATPTGSAPSYTCRAWVNFNGTGTVAVRASGNVSSISDNGTGEYTVNLTTAMPDANYAVTALTGVVSGSADIRIRNSGPITTSTFGVLCTNGSQASVQDNDYIHVAFFR